MKRAFNKIFPIIIMVLVVVSACVAPPKPNTTTSSTSGGTSQSGTGQSLIKNTTFQYITIETPYQTPTTPGTTQRIVAANLTTIPPVEWVEIYRTTQVFSYNKTAISFDLKNPPMLIHFNVMPINVTRDTSTFQHWDAGPGQMTSTNTKYEYFSPYSWFEVTVRNKDTGRILVQDGFGNTPENQYSQNTNRTFKVLTRGNLLIELAGNQVTAMVDMKVDKKDNIIS
jgi:hypothetical protein